MEVGKMDQVRELVRANSEKGWDEAWKIGVTPWDAGTVQPPLKELIESKKVDLPTSGRALVPGCGRGYDAVWIAHSLGLDTLGTDISPTAVKAAQDYLVRTGNTANGSVRFEVADFFAIEEAGFELVYDYTFFVAIPPARRVEWGRQMSKLVKPGGFLITLIFPIVEYTAEGPPFYVRAEHYEEVLGETEWETVVDENAETTLDSHRGKQRLVVRRKRLV